jgi:hypothetical protein
MLESREFASSALPCIPRVTIAPSFAFPGFGVARRATTLLCARTFFVQLHPIHRARKPLVSIVLVHVSLGRSWFEWDKIFGGLPILLPQRLKRGMD